MKQTDLDLVLAMVRSLVDAGGETNYNDWSNRTENRVKVLRSKFDSTRKELVRRGIVSSREDLHGKRKLVYYRLAKLPFEYSILDHLLLELPFNYSNPETLVFPPNPTEDDLRKSTVAQRKRLMNDFVSRLILFSDFYIMSLLLLEGKKETYSEFYEAWYDGLYIIAREIENLFKLFAKTDSATAEQVWEELAMTLLEAFKFGTRAPKT